MAKQTKTRVAATVRKVEFNARELWLASLGAMVLTRKQGIKLYDTLMDEGRGAQERVSEVFANVTETMNNTVESVRGRVDAIVTPLRGRAEATLALVKDEVETRLQPVLARIGVKMPSRTIAKGSKLVRKAAAKSRRAGVRKAA